MKLLNQTTEILSKLSPWVYIFTIIAVLVFPNIITTIPLKEIVVKVHTINESEMPNYTAVPGVTPEDYQVVTYTYTCSSNSKNEICKSNDQEFHFPATPGGGGIEKIVVQLGNAVYQNNSITDTHVYDTKGRKKYKILLISIDGSQRLTIISRISQGHIIEHDLDIKGILDKNLIGDSVKCVAVESKPSVLKCREQASVYQILASISPF